MVRIMNYMSSDWKLNTVEVKQMEMFDEPDDLLVGLEAKPFEFTPGQKVFITSKCSIPRTKIKESFKEKGLKITHNLEDADHIIIDKEFFSHHTIRNYSSFYRKETVQKLLADSTMILQAVKDKEVRQSFENIVKGISKLSADDFIMEYRVARAINDTMIHANLINEEGDPDYDSERHELKTLSKNTREFFLKVIDNLDKVVLEEKLISMTNGQIHMGEELFTSLCKYMESDDNDNRVLAMETMANCNYESSALYLLLLIEKYGHKMRDSRVSSYVNFKSMLRFFDISRWKLERLGYDDILDILHKKNLLNQGYIDIITPLAFEEMKQGRTFNWFDIKEIQIVYPKDRNEDDQDED